MKSRGRASDNRSLRGLARPRSLWNWSSSSGSTRVARVTLLSVDVCLDSPGMRTRHDPSPGQLALGLVDDAEAIRDALVVHLRGRRHHARFISEMGMNHGAARIDLAVIDDSLDGYEIKSSQDDLRRLEGQAIAYGQVFDRLTLVGAERHLEPAARVVPAWWGLTLVDVSRSVIEPLRHAGRNPTVDPASMVRLLWHSELEAVLESTTIRCQCRSAPASRGRDAT